MIAKEDDDDEGGINAPVAVVVDADRSRPPLLFAGGRGGGGAVACREAIPRPWSGGRDRPIEADDAVSVSVAVNGIRPSLPIVWKPPAGAEEPAEVTAWLDARC